MPLHFTPRSVRSGARLAGITVAAPLIFCVVIVGISMFLIGLTMLLTSFGTIAIIGTVFLVFGILLMISSCTCCYVAYRQASKVRMAGLASSQPGHVYNQPQPGPQQPPGQPYPTASYQPSNVAGYPPQPGPPPGVPSGPPPAHQPAPLQPYSDAPPNPASSKPYADSSGAYPVLNKEDLSRDVESEASHLHSQPPPAYNPNY